RSHSPPPLHDALPIWLKVLSVADAVKEADVVVLLAPDQVQRIVYSEEIAPNLADGAALVFGHGFNIRYGFIQPKDTVDVIMVARSEEHTSELQSRFDL